MPWRILGAATIALSITIPFNTSGRAAVGEVGLRPVPCADQSWTYDDPVFEALPGAKASFGRYDGGLYRVEIPEDWNGELVLWAHGFVDNKGAQGSRLRVGFPGAGQGEGRSASISSETDSPGQPRAIAATATSRAWDCSTRGR